MILVKQTKAKNALKTSGILPVFHLVLLSLAMQSPKPPPYFCIPKNTNRNLCYPQRTHRFKIHAEELWTLQYRVRYIIFMLSH